MPLHRTARDGHCGDAGSQECCRTWDELGRRPDPCLEGNDRLHPAKTMMSSDTGAGPAASSHVDLPARRTVAQSRLALPADLRSSPPDTAAEGSRRLSNARGLALGES